MISSLWFLYGKLVLILVLPIAGIAWNAEIHAASLRLMWADTSTDEDGFKIERLIAGLLDATLTVGTNLTSYTDSGLSAGGIYCYRVRAFNAAGDSGPSNQACAIAQNPGVNVALAPVTVSVSPTTVAPKGTITSTWSGIATATPKDWLGLYTPGATDRNFIDWIYVSCTKTAGSARASGSCSFVIPSTLSPGSYELRLFANDGYTRLGTTGPLAVAVSGSTSTSPAQKPIVSVSPTTIAPGGTITASWSGIVAATPKDWIGLYAPGATNKNFIDWIYVSCTKTASSARASGSCSFVIPSTLSPGSYELRLFANDGYTRLASSSALTVSTQGTGSIVLSNQNSGVGNGSNSTMISQVTTRWTDYRLALRLRSMDDDSIGVMFRYQDNNNYYRFSWNRESKFRRLERIQNGVPTVLAQDSIRYVVGREYQVEISAQGAVLKVLIDDSLVFSVTDATFTEGTIALYSFSNQGSFFDQILVEDLSTGAVLLSEDFNDGNFNGWTTIDDKGTIGGASVWSAQSGDLVQSSNMRSNSPAKLGTFALYTKGSWTNYRTTMKIKSLDNDAIGVMFRYQDNSNYYRFVWHGDGSLGRKLEKLENGVLEILAQDSVPYVIGRDYQLEIISHDTTLQIRIDGALVFSVTDSSFTGGTVALYSAYNQGSVFDDILVKDLVTGTVLLQDNFDASDFKGWTIIDEGLNGGPSVWSVSDGSLVQTSNIGSNSTLGTFALY